MSLPVSRKLFLYGESSSRNLYGYQHKPENIFATTEKNPNYFHPKGFHIIFDSWKIIKYHFKYSTSMQD